MSSFYGGKSVQYVPFIDTVHRNLLLLSADETLLVFVTRQCDFA